MAEKVQSAYKEHRLKGSGPVDRKYLSKLYAFRDKMKREAKKGNRS